MNKDARRIFIQYMLFIYQIYHIDTDTKGVESLDFLTKTLTLKSQIGNILGANRI